MEKIVLGVFTVVALIFFAPVLGVIFGAFSGWVVGLFFSGTVLGFLGRLGVDVNGLQLWQVGAAMGFLGGFLKTNVSKSSK